MNPINFNLIDDSEEIKLELVDDNEEINFSMTDYDDTEIKNEISDLQSQVNSNTNNIAQNTSDIEQNKADISDLNDRVDEIPIVTKTSQLTNDSGYITKNVNNLTNYYTTTQVDNKVNFTIDGQTYTTVQATMDQLISSIAEALETKQDTITPSSKLYSDLVDDDNQTHKFVTSADKTTWSGKADYGFTGIITGTTTNPTDGSTLANGTYMADPTKASSYISLPMEDGTTKRQTVQKGGIVIRTAGRLIVFATQNLMYQYDTSNHYFYPAESFIESIIRRDGSGGAVTLNSVSPPNTYYITDPIYSLTANFITGQTGHTRVTFTVSDDVTDEDPFELYLEDEDSNPMLFENGIEPNPKAGETWILEIYGNTCEAIRFSDTAVLESYNNLLNRPIITYIDTEINNRVVTQVTRTKTVEDTHDSPYYGTYHFIPLDMSSYTGSGASKALKPEDHLPAGRYVVTAEGYLRLGTSSYKLAPGTFIFWDGDELDLIGYNACEYWSYYEGEWDGGYFTTQSDVQSLIEDAVISTVIPSGNFDVASKDNGYYLFNYNASSGTGRRIIINVEGTSTYYYPYNGTVLIKNDKYVVMLGRENLIFEYDSENSYYKTPIDITSIANKYEKPSGGIPSTDMTSAVQTSLGKADDSIQKTGGSGTQTVSLTSGTGTTALGLKSMSASSYLSLSGTGGWLGSYGVSSDKKPVYYNGTGYTLAYTSDIPTQTSQLTNNSNYVADASYVHTDNNYTTTDKTKLEGIETGAEVNVQSNWNETNTSSDSYIQNKPSIPKVFYGTSSTGASTAAKVVTCGDFTSSDLVAGTRITVLFTNANSFNGQATLNINGTGAKNIYYNGTSTNARYMWVAGETVDFVYNGTQWATINGGLATTTYYGVTKLYTGAGSDSQALALTPRSLYYLANYSIAPYYSASSTYAVGDKVRYTYYLYECKTAIETAEAWNAEHWTQLDPLQDQIDSLKAEIEALRNSL